MKVTWAAFDRGREIVETRLLLAVFDEAARFGDESRVFGVATEYQNWPSAERSRATTCAQRGSLPTSVLAVFGFLTVAIVITIFGVR
jgi:hypothetical protein